MKPLFSQRLIVTLWFVVALVGCATPAKVEIVPDKVVLDGAGATAKLAAKVFDKNGEELTEGVEIVWFSDDTDIFKLSQDGEVSAVASGEGKVEVEVVGAKLTAEAPVRVKIPASINVSHERLRLWTGQVKENVWAEVHSEKGAFIEGYLPEWTSEDPTVVKVEQIDDPNRRQSWVRMTGMKSGNTFIYATFQGISQQIKVGVFDEDEEVALDGTRIPKDAKQEQEKEEAQPKGKKKKKGKK